MLTLLASFALIIESRSIVAVIDTGIHSSFPKKFLCKKYHKDFTNSSLDDREGHGTNVAGIISQGLDSNRQCLVIIKWHDTVKSNNRNVRFGRLDRIIRNSILYAESLNPILINLSVSGDMYSNLEYNTYRNIISKGVHLVVSAGNDGLNLTEICNVYPACYPIKSPYYHVVASYGPLTRRIYSNYGAPITDFEDGNNVEYLGLTRSGTSQAAAKVSARILKTL